ncbi:MAG: RNA polymerase sigma factor [Verrucomicrobiales bacterium]
MPSSSQPEPATPEKLSLRALFEEQEGPLLRYAYSLVGRREIAEEVVQDGFLQLHTHWESVDNPKAWLYRCVRNRAFDHHRKYRRETLTDGEHEPESAGESPDALLQRMEAAGFLRLLLAELEEADSQLVRLKYFEDLKYREISERTGLSVGNVGYRLHHILNQLGAKLQHFGIEQAP